MKRIVIMAVIALFPMIFAASSFAASCNDAWTAVDVGCTIGSTANGAMEMKGSKSVMMQYNGTTGLTYSIGAYHSQGNRKFASSSGDQKIFYFEFTTAINASAPGGIPVAPTGIAGSTWTDGWSAM